MNSILNPYKNKRIEFHILQSFPSTCLNRDDVDSPKTALIGGVSRARVSSQCWKRAIREAMHEYSNVELGIRTKLVSDLFVQKLLQKGVSEDKAKECGDAIESKIKAEVTSSSDSSKSGALIHLAPSEIDYIINRLAELNYELNIPEDAGKRKKKKKTDNDPKETSLKDILMALSKKNLANNENLDGLDIALFGRMIAQAKFLNINAAASFSHAISTHRVVNEFDFFTANADFSNNEFTTAAHLDANEFNSATYYRYVSLDLGQLYESLGSTRFFEKAIKSFTEALYIAVPQARQTSFAGSCLWDYAEIVYRKGQGIQLSFETPVQREKNGGFLQNSIKQLKESLDHKIAVSGSLYGQILRRTFGTDKKYSIDNLVKDLCDAVMSDNKGK